MPTRLIREGILDSKPINALSEQAELFYRRLMSIVDDYGRFEADADLIRARCFPRQFDRWPVDRIEQCLSEISGGSPLVTVYHCGDKRLLQINNFGQRVQSKPKYAGPESPESTVDHGEPPPSRSRSFGVGGVSEHAQNSAPSARVVVDKISKDSEITRWFEQEFWPLYPHKKSKDAALAACKKKAVTPEVRARIIAAVKEQTPGICARPSDKRPYPATWLNAGAWKDEPDEPVLFAHSNGKIHDPSNTEYRD